MNFNINKSDKLVVGGLLIFTVIFNALLAFVNQHVMHVGTIHVIICEMLIVVAVWGFSIIRFTPIMYPWMYLTLAFFVLSMLIGILNTELNPKFFRDMLIIITFGLLGICYRKYDIVSLFKWLTYIVVGVMFVEAFFTDIYAQIFNPSSYFFNTRGVGDFDSETGLFRNVMKIEGRFSLGIFDAHRLASIFMEQTTLGNFAIILALFTSVFWKQLTKKDKLFFCISIFLIISGTNSRLSIGTISCFIALNFLVKILPRYSNVLYMPFFLGVTALLFYDSQMHEMVDNFNGRIAWNIHLLADMNLEQILGMDIAAAATAMDSGYAYIVFTQSIIGAILLWLFISFILPQTTLEDKKMAHMVSFFMVFGLAVGGAILSIKTTAPLWFLVGYIYGKVTDMERQNYVKT